MRITITLEPGDDPEVLRRLLGELLGGAVTTKQDQAKLDHWFLTPADKRKRRRAATRPEESSDATS